MTPKEKAMELMLRYYELIPMNTVSFAKQCALITVDEMLYVLNIIDNSQQWSATHFYNEVKQELEQL